MSGRIVYLSEVPADQPPQMFADVPDVLNVSRCAEVLGVSAQTIRRLVASGELPSIRVGRSVRVTKAALLRFVGEGADHE